MSEAKPYSAEEIEARRLVIEDNMADAEESRWLATLDEARAQIAEAALAFRQIGRELEAGVLDAFLASEVEAKEPTPARCPPCPSCGIHYALKHPSGALFCLSCKYDEEVTR